MALWNPKKSPDKYPLIYHEAILSLEYPTVIAVAESLGKANHQRKKFNSFKASLRTYPLHQTAQRIKILGLVSRVKIRQSGSDYIVEVRNRRNSLQSLKISVDILDKIP